MKALSQTSIYSYIDKNKGVDYGKEIKKFLDDPHTMVLTQDNMADIFAQMKMKSFGYRGARVVLGMYDRGIIQLVYNGSRNLSSAVPFFKRALPGGKVGVVINISPFATMRKSDSMITKMSPHLLYTLMLGAASSINMDSMAGLLESSGVSALYGRILTNIFARMSPVDVATRTELQFLCNKFYMAQLYGNDFERREDGLTLRLFKQYPIDPSMLRSINDKFNTSDFDNLEVFLNKLKEVFPQLSKINLYVVFDKWLSSLGEPSAFGIEFVPYFVTSILAMLTSCVEYVNVVTLEREASRDDKGELSKMMVKLETNLINSNT